MIHQGSNPLDDILAAKWQEDDGFTFCPSCVADMRRVDGSADIGVGTDALGEAVSSVVGE